MVQFGIMKDATLVGFTKEVTDGTDPATDRLLWPGKVTNIGTPTEDYGNTTLNPVGNQTRSDFMSQKTKNEYEFEIESTFNQPFVKYDTDHIWGGVLGTVTTSTGLVVIVDPLSTYTVEFGWDDGTGPTYYVFKGCKIASLTVSATPGELIQVRTRFKPRILDGNNTDPVVTSGISLSDLQNHKFIPHGSVTDGPYVVGDTITGSISGATGTIVSIGSNFLDYDPVAGTMQSGEVLTGTTGSLPKATSSSVPRPATRKPSAHFKDITFAFQQGDGSSFTATPKVRQFDWTIENNLVPVPSDNQSFDVPCYAEGGRLTTWALKMNYQDREWLDISREDSGSEEGQFKMSFTIDHDWAPNSTTTTQNGYLSVNLGIATEAFCALAEHENPLGSDVAFLELAFACRLYGDPSIDLAP